MKKFLTFVSIVTSFGIVPVFAQLGMGGSGQGPHFDGAMNKLYGDNKSFSALLEFQTTGNGSNTVTMPGTFTFDNGKSRFELNISDVHGSMISPAAAQQMTAMGVGTTIAISRPDLKMTYLVYPGLNSYAQVPAQDASGSVNVDDFKMETADQGKETLDGHDCVIKKATVTDKEGNKHEFTVWNATDLKNFPVKVVTNDGGRPATMSYKNVTFSKPAASLFEPPTGFTKYDDLQTMMQTEIMKKMGGGGAPAPH